MRSGSSIFACRLFALSLLFTVATLGGSATSLASSAATAAADYERLLGGRYTTSGTPIPAGGVTFQRAEAIWTLESGDVRLAEPTADGQVTGLVFEGRGRFQMAIPDPVEQKQWRRLSAKSDQNSIDVPFSTLVLRTSGDLITELFGPASGASHSANKTALERHENWLIHRFVDADARVVSGLLMPGDDYLRVEMKTTDFDWLTYDYDELRQEEIVVSRFDPKESFVEDWVSLDRPEDRDASGRPVSPRRFLIDLEHVDLQIDITKAGKDARAGLSDVHPRRASIAAEMRFTSQVEGYHVLPLALSSWAEVSAVKTPEGRALPFLRDHIGGRTSAYDKRIYDGSLAVILDQPLVRGEQRRIVVEYEMDFLNYAGGRGWYPGEEDGFLDIHTAKLVIAARNKDDVRAMGQLQKGGEPGARGQVWKIDQPTKMVTFSFAERFHEEKLESEGLPEVIAFAASSGITVKNKTFNVAADVMNSMTYFRHLFGHAPQTEQMYVTSIIGSHGQAFDGFIHLSELSFNFETQGPTQLFRAHEVAHQWWGHKVGWSSYRDQWISEAFAEYSAMMFLESTMEKGREYYDEIVEAFTGQMLGVVKPSQFARFPFEANDKQRQRVGPISVGRRASTATSPSGYTAQAYYKGPLVLHMLRTLLRNMTKSEEPFLTILKDILNTRQGGTASTADVLAALNHRVPTQGGWDWFFDQWIHDTAIPTYTWSYEVGGKDANGKYVLKIDVEQTGVPAGFRMPIPVQIDFGKNQGGQVMIMVDQPTKTLSVPLPKKPKKVTFNPGDAVLARVKKR